MKKLNLLIFGPPGSGKGTQASELAKKHNLIHISTGDLFRYELSNKTELGTKALEYSSKGILVPDDITIDMLTNRLSWSDVNEAKGVIYDGYPRTIYQAEKLEEILNIKSENINLLIYLKVDEQTIIKRILSRGTTSGRVDDTDESIIKLRISEYYKNTKAVYNRYKEIGSCVEIDGIGTVEEIFEIISNEISNISFP